MWFWCSLCQGHVPARGFFADGPLPEAERKVRGRSRVISRFAHRTRRGEDAHAKHRPG